MPLRIASSVPSTSIFTRAGGAIAFMATSSSTLSPKHNSTAAGRNTLLWPSLKVLPNWLPVTAGSRLV